MGNVRGTSGQQEIEGAPGKPGTYQSIECKEWIKRTLHNKIQEHGVKLAKYGDKVYYKKMEKKEKWRGPHHQNTKWN